MNKHVKLVHEGKKSFKCDIYAMNKYKYFLEITIGKKNPNVISKRLWPPYDAPLNLN